MDLGIKTMMSRGPVSLVNLNYYWNFFHSDCISLTRLWYASYWSQFQFMSCTHQWCFLCLLHFFNCINLYPVTISNKLCYSISNRESCNLDWLAMLLAWQSSAYSWILLTIILSWQMAKNRHFPFYNITHNHKSHQTKNSPN